MSLCKKLLSLALTVAMVTALAGCSTSNSSSSGSQSETQGEEKVLNIFTWAGYFPDDILAEFTEATGIEVNFVPFESNDEMLMKLQAAQGGDYDIVLASDYIIDIARNEGLLKELDTSKIPNFVNIASGFQNQYYDPENKYTVPYAAGIPLIVYNPEMVDFEITGYEDLWNPALADSVVVMDDARNVIGLTLKTMGESLNTTDPEILEQAKEKLMTLKPNIRALDYNTPHNLMISGETAVGYMFTSQVVTALQANPDLKVVYPKEGLGFGIDACFVPVNAPHPDNAFAFLDFILDGERCARISEQTLYINCNSAAAAEEYELNPALIISNDIIENAEMIKDVGETASLYNDIWTEFKLS